ncbi:hypothetical protein ACONRW_004519 [Vibrio parahaemolyticus]|uniref:hypothetical protein n=1 Tax=Vibrio parahaemolyticus TaxID=670 RepID=UPI001E0D0764|nr:hypothetical protein [Vibrio parahaemolyticus]MBE5191695.1 hypothetical protein [Vibrio parahaemolyticus]HCM1428292.1 hypothetical protein [Vibrio parahaemolyticus]
MPGSNQKTRVSAKFLTVKDKTVIEFLSSPEYRNNNVDLGEVNQLELFKIERLNGQNSGGIRAEVSNLNQKTGRCKVNIENTEFAVHVGYQGPVSVGIEEY